MCPYKGDKQSCRHFADRGWGAGKVRGKRTPPCMLSAYFPFRSFPVGLVPSPYPPSSTLSGAGCSGGNRCQHQPAGNITAACSSAVASAAQLPLLTWSQLPPQGRQRPGPGSPSSARSLPVPAPHLGVGERTCAQRWWYAMLTKPHPTTLGAQIPKAWPGCAKVSQSTQRGDVRGGGAAGV